jgi:glutamine cyclotransferase
MTVPCRKYIIPFTLLSVFIFSLSALAIEKQETSVATEYYSYRIINAYPHDTGAFTQGLIYNDGFLYESTGLRGRSMLLKVDLISGKPEKLHKLPDSYFGEGITVIGERIIQLTWRSRRGFVYDKRDFRLLKQFAYSTEGWGITFDGERLIMSDGTDNLYFLDPETFKEKGRLQVRENGGALTRLNELEFIGGKIYANVWQTDRIAIISPSTGNVDGWINLEELARLSGGDRRIKTLNGIAYDKSNDRLFVTGKFWPVIYEIKLVPADK